MGLATGGEGLRRVHIKPGLCNDGDSGQIAAEVGREALDLIGTPSLPRLPRLPSLLSRFGMRAAVGSDIAIGTQGYLLTLKLKPQEPRQWLAECFGVVDYR
jgi:hypothetical protein